ncbi:hypothetical protein Pmani_005498 [Petrolisthes manimaculis]|uniref:Uncharacterized protein n=1 Tax=Petrolisthes manimaculis TaxID=1843537 RepID=A0AAE1QBM4_9EUCA|nr:hypothetical protein Pmani_005498 [Petrolisthes manimaculis]
MPLLGNCCFFIDLKVGTKIIGALKLIAAIINTIVLIGDPVDVGGYGYMEWMQPRKPIASQPPLPQPRRCLYVLLALYSALIITASMLIHGVRTNRRNLLLPYIVQEVISLFIFIGIAPCPH